ncbi:hypothetical protein BJ170DRAFT_258935 [Xylariales sp. AK1849]|nr:hypothetical protein BJ170DRAFT_258935 [Xylariales sp. AK1849]
MGSFLLSSPPFSSYNHQASPKSQSSIRDLYSPQPPRSFKYQTLHLSEHSPTFIAMHFTKSMLCLGALVAPLMTGALAAPKDVPYLPDLPDPNKYKTHPGMSIEACFEVWNGGDLGALDRFGVAQCNQWLFFRLGKHWSQALHCQQACNDKVRDAIARGEQEFKCAKHHGIAKCELGYWLAYKGPPHKGVKNPGHGVPDHQPAPGYDIGR